MNTNTTQPTKHFLDRHAAIVSMLLIITILGAGWFLLLAADARVIQESSADAVRSRQEILAQKKKSLASLQDLQESLTNLDHERLAQVAEILPDGLEPAHVISQMHELAEKAGVTMESVDVVSEQSDSLEKTVTDGVHTAVITMVITIPPGDYGTMKRLLQTIEQFTPLLNLQTLSYNAAMTSMTLQLQTSYL